MKKIIVFCMLLCGAAAFSQEAMPRFEIPTARSNGWGGHHAAYTDNVFALLVNPAAIMRVEQRSFFTLSPTLFSPQSTFDLIGSVNDMIKGDMNSFGGAMDTLSKNNGKLPLGLDIREFPLSVAWVADGFGFGLWDRIFVNPQIIGTNVRLEAYADVILPVGFAFRILDTDAHSVDAGVTVKAFARARAHETVGIFKLAGDTDDFVDDISVPVIAGAGFDLGFLYRWDIGLSAGLTFDDIFTRGKVVSNIIGEDTNSYYVPFTMNFGAAYDLVLGRFWTTAPGFLANMGFTFTFDYRDIGNLFEQDDYLKRNAVLGIGTGLQVSMFNVLKLRLGMNEMLPAVGAGVDLGPFKIDAAYYGKEFGNEPGQLSGAALDLTIAIRPGAKKRDWPWTRKSLVGLFTK
ncbi:MAG: hypothetical protein LBP29_03930 [Treponema sp.]|jgi:hypothetical protein|nr:hypothetical protein [Treponema sp.]